MIIGIGCDLVEIKRFKKSTISHLVKRILTDKEKANFDCLKNYDRQVEYIAGRFAAKEAYSKAMGTGIGQLSFKDIEVLNDKLGKPYINIATDDIIHLTITHTKYVAQAFVVIEKI